jgi:hypothetical protein
VLLGESALNRPVIRPGAFDDDDQVFEGVASRCIANALYGCVEAESVMRDCARLDENAAVEVSEHDLGARLGTIHAKDAKVLGTDGLDSWVNDTTRLLQSVTTRLAAIPWGELESHWTEPPKKVETNPNSILDFCNGRLVLRILDHLLLVKSL